MTDVMPRLTAALADRYRLDRELGAGGMATVYLAHDLKHDRDVAIKVLHPDLGAALGAERFLSEIRTTARLQHPHILPLLDSGDADGLLYYVMPLVTGETLRARLERERQLPIADAVRIAREVASALDYAHRQNVIHRDIKPENILLHDGSALVADFGIALAVQSAGGQRMTQTGLSLGTPQYMSPEQAMGERTIDARSDIYALGAVTYEMLAGEPPFSGPTVQAIVAKVMSTEPASIVSLRKAVPAHVAAAVHGALEKLPADRCESAKTFSDMLADARGAYASTAFSTATTMPTASAQLSRTVVAGALAIAVVSMAVAAWGWRRPAGQAASPYRVVPMVAGDASAGALAMSPDGSQYTAAGRDSTGAVVLLLHSLVGAPTRRVHAGAVLVAYFSPDGRQLAYVDNSTQSLIVQDLTSGTLRTLAAGVQARGLAWVSNDTLVVSTSDGRATQYPLNGAPPLLLRGAVDSLMIGALAATGDGRLIARANRPGTVLLVGIRDGGRQIDSLYTATAQTTEGSGRIAVVDGVLLFLEGGRLWGLPLAADGRAVAGERRDLLGRDGPGEITAWAASQSGSLLVVRAAAGAVERELILVTRDGRSTLATTQRLPYRRPRYAPSGTQIASMRTPGVFGPLWVTDLTRGSGQWAGGDSIAYSQQWTPDGRQLLTSIRRGRQTQVVRSAAEGGGTPTTLFEHSNMIFEMEITPDGRTLVWREDAPSTGRDILMVPLDRPGEPVPVRVSKWDERGIALSRDGKWLAYTSNESGGNEVFLCRLEPNGPRWAVSQGGGAEPRWGANGELFYRKGDSVFVLRVTGTDVPIIGTPSLVAVVPAIKAPYEPLWDVRRDGQQFVMVRQAGAVVSEQLLVLNWQDRWRSTATDKRE